MERKTMSETKKTCTRCYQEGMNAVRSKPQVAPRNPYEEDEQPKSYSEWEEGAIEAGICDIYTNGILNRNAR